MSKNFTWSIILDKLLGEEVMVETLEGIQRKGKLSGVKYQDLDLFGRKVQIPIAVELNEDPQEAMTLQQIRFIKFID